MRIKLISDTHLENFQDGGMAFVQSLALDRDAVDVLVIAGDFATRTNLGKHLRAVCSMYADVVYVTGNHEYYGSTREEIHAILEGVSSDAKNFHWLNNSFAVINGQRFLGGTMWFPYESLNQMYERSFSDFAYIRGLASWVYDNNNQFKALIARECGVNDIVVSHHLPSPKSVSPQFHGDPYNRFFLCDMEKHISLRQPKLWLHGHSHDSLDYNFGRLRVVCNPYGYQTSVLNPEFKNSLIIQA